MQLRRPDVVDGAITILDEYGLGDLTMRRLATSLGVGPGALYWHVANKQALLGAVSDRILERMDRPGPPTDGRWDVDLAELAHRLRDALLTHRDGAEVVATSLSARTVTHPVEGTLTAVLRAGGLDADDATSAARSLMYYVLGATTDEQSRMQMDSVGALPADESGGVGRDATAEFGFGLDLFLDGVRSRVRTLQG